MLIALRCIASLCQAVGERHDAGRRGRARHRPDRQLLVAVGVVMQPEVVGAVDVDDDQPFGGDGDVGGGVLGPPMVDLLLVGGGVEVAVFGDRRLAARAQGNTG